MLDGRHFHVRQSSQCEEYHLKRGRRYKLGLHRHVARLSFHRTTVWT